MSRPATGSVLKGEIFTCDVKLSGGGKAELTVTQTTGHDTFSYAFRPGSVGGSRWQCA